MLLELSFDPPESDTNKILEAISKKQKEWSLSLANPVRGAMYREYLTHLDDIKKVMLNPTARKQEADGAKQIKSENVVQLQRIMRLFRAKTTTLSERDMKHLIKRFGKYGFTAEEIKKEFKHACLDSN